MADDRTQRQRMLAGDLYIADDPELAADSLRARRLQDRFNGGGAIVLAGVDIGENTVVGAGSVVTPSLPANVVAVGSPARVKRSL